MVSKSFDWYACPRYVNGPRLFSHTSSSICGVDLFLMVWIYIWASFHTPWLPVEALCFLHHPLPSLPLTLLIKTYTCHVFVSITVSFASEDVGLYYVVRDVGHDSWLKVGGHNLNPQNLAPVEIESITTGFEFLSSMQVLASQHLGFRHWPAACFNDSSTDATSCKGLMQKDWKRPQHLHQCIGCIKPCYWHGIWSFVPSQAFLAAFRDTVV